MGLKAYVLDRIEMVHAQCTIALDQLVQAGQVEGAIQFQTEVLEPLENVALDLDRFEDPNGDEDEHIDAPIESEVQAKRRQRRKKKAPIRGKRFKCCSKPKKSRDWKGNPIWVSTCPWRAGRKFGNMTVTVARGKQRPPKQLFATPKGGISAQKPPAGGKRVRWCGP